MRKKPDLASGSGELVNHEFIPATVRAELLRNLINSPLTVVQKTELLTSANNVGQAVLDGKPQTGKSQRKQIEAIEANSKRLLASIALMQQPALEAMHSHTLTLAFGSAPPAELRANIKNAIQQPGVSLLSTAWDWVDALQNTAQHALTQYSIDKQSKPNQMRAKDYVSILAQQVRDLTGVLPPKDRNAWFACFAYCLGEHLSLKIGSRIVASGIAALEK